MRPDHSKSKSSHAFWVSKYFNRIHVFLHFCSVREKYGNKPFDPSSPHPLLIADFNLILEYFTYFRFRRYALKIV